jgi:hypothetical protein
MDRGAFTITDHPPPAAPADPRAQVIAWLLDGHRQNDIAEAIATRWPDADPAELTTAAVDHFAAAANYDLGVLVGFTLEAYRDLYRRMVALGDLPNAAKVLKELLATAAKYQQPE